MVSIKEDPDGTDQLLSMIKQASTKLNAKKNQLAGNKSKEA